MTLLFEYAARQFAPDDASHVRPGDAELGGEGPSDDSLSLDSLVSVLPNRARWLAHPERDDWLCVPLHESDSAALTDEYVVYEDHPVRGDVFVYLDADGDPEPLPADDFADSALARRVRFWLPGAESDELSNADESLDADELPDYADHPVSREPPAESLDPDAYFDRLGSFVEAEREAERERNREAARHRTPRQRFEDDDAAIPEIGGLSRTDRNRVRFHVLAEDTHGDVRDRFGVFEGNEVLLDSNDPADAPDRLPVEATVDRIADFTIDLVLQTGDSDNSDADSANAADAADSANADADAAIDALESADSLGLSLLRNDLPTSREQAGVEAARSDAALRDLLTGNRDATFDCEVGRRTEPADPDLNERQELAATCACYAADAFCVHGPPGTGKTRVLVEVVRRAVGAGERVLACADSNQAVDNLLAGASTEDAPDEGSLHYVAEVEGEFELARHRADHSDEAFVRDNYGRHGEASAGTADVVATTNNSAAELDADFDLVVVDEATQATVTSTLVSATRGDRLVLAGDHRQLPPFEARTTPDEDRHRSLFEHLYAEGGGPTEDSRASSDSRSGGVYGHRIGTMLTTQYRMHELVARFPNRRFYDGAIRNGRDVSPIDGLPPVVRADVSGSERTDHHSYANPAEAEEVVSLVERLLDAGVNPENVGVITPYEAQVREIRGRLDRRVEVDTIDSFQGGEREAVVVSFVRSNDRGDVGFLGRAPDGPRRLNVALTRAERFLALVGDWETLREPDGADAESDGSGSDLYRSLDEFLDGEAASDLE